MKSFANIALRTEFSFGNTFGKIESLANYANGALGVADLANTFSHIHLEKLSKKNNFKPLYGVRLEVVQDEYIKTRGMYGATYIFIAKNQDGLIEINELVRLAYDLFYYKPHVSMSALKELSNNVIVIAEAFEQEDRIDFFALTPSTSPMLYRAANEFNLPCVYVNNNFYSTPDEKQIYQIIAGTQKHGDEYRYNFDNRSHPQHILNEYEFNRFWKDKSAIDNTQVIADMCEQFDLKRAPMVRYDGARSIEKWCALGAKKLGINLKVGEYAERYKREMLLINEKQYTDYFLIVAEMIEKAKSKMLVGCARGSSAGSLVCYLMGITTIDPIKFGLLFERFIDINRMDLPDIDVDFPDLKRDLVIKDLIKKYGEENVTHISNINRMKAKSTISDFAIALRIPKYKSDPIKDSIDDKIWSGNETIKNMFESTEAGQEFIKEYPAMMLATKTQGHASHVGRHAAGVIICNDPITTYGGVNVRPDINSIMLDGKGAEYLNLLKIDILGLRTLTILQDCADMVGMDFKDFYTLKLDNKKTFRIFKDMRLNGVFQFEGDTLKGICQKMGVEDFNDLVSITAIARPGAMQSGGTERFIKKRTGEALVEYSTEQEGFVNATKETYGEFLYQEQIMNVCRYMADMSWEDVSSIRKIIAKSAGADALKDYKKSFIDGSVKNGVEEETAIDIWDSIVVFGQYAFNKSHAVAYSHISYWCAYMKAHFCLEFTAANLKHAKDNKSAIRILRDAVENEGVEYIPIDPDTSEINWSVVGDKLVGGLINIKGIAEKKAREILTMRKKEKKFTPAIAKLLLNPVTDFDTIYPCRDKFNVFYTSPRKVGLSSPVEYIKNVTDLVDNEYLVLGRVIKKELKDTNEYGEVLKRGGQKHEHNAHMVLRMEIEDDTGVVRCNIGRFDFNKLDGHRLFEELIEDESFILIRGKVSAGYRSIKIKNIFDLTDFETPEDENEI
jgi:DNA polymerase III alpha subunit